VFVPGLFEIMVKLLFKSISCQIRIPSN